MKAIGIVSENIGGPELLEVVEVAKPVPAAEEVLLRVKASSFKHEMNSHGRKHGTSMGIVPSHDHALLSPAMKFPGLLKQLVKE